MNKVSILSYSTTKNYGGLLQMFAMQTVLKREGYHAEHIQYSEPKTIQKNKIKRIISKIYSFFLRKIVFDRKRFKNESRFREEISFSENLFTSSSDLSNYETDYFVVGSDQVWNPYINGFDSSYALSFYTKGKKLAYSVSFGLDKNIPEKWLEVLVQSLTDFKYISVREESAKNVLGSFLNEAVNVDLDPTLLLNKEEYSSLAKKSSITIKEKFILCYLMPGDSVLTNKIVNEAKRVAKAKRIRLITIGLRDVNRLNIFDKTKLFGVGPYEFIYLISNAEAIFTNSFHGAAISSLLNKKFFAFVNSNPKSADYLGDRLTNLLVTLGLENNCVDINKTNSSINYDIPIDYKTANAVLKKKKDESLKRLVQGLK